MIAITGTSGLLGANLVRELLKQGCRVRAILHRDDRAVRGLELETVAADLNNPASLERAFEGVHTLYHLASLISLSMHDWDQLYRVNVIGTRNVVQACLRCEVKRLAYFGSVHAHRPEPFDQPLEEGRPLVTNPQAPPYDRSKALGELEVLKGLESGLDAVILLPSAILGPYDFRPSYAGEALQLLCSGRLPALTTGGYDWVDARDVSWGAIRAAQSAPMGRCYILSGHWLSLRDVAHMAAQIRGGHAPRLLVPLRLAELAAPLMQNLTVLRGSEPLFTRAMLSALRSNRLITHARASQELDYAPRPFRETLGDTLAWFDRQRRAP